MNSYLVYYICKQKLLVVFLKFSEINHHLITKVYYTIKIQNAPQWSGPLFCSSSLQHKALQDL